MNLETKKIKSPFKPDAKYLSDLASRVQSKVGIDNKEIFKQDKFVKIPSKRKEALQLTVEFGFPLKSEISKDLNTSETQADVHVEPINAVIEEVLPEAGLSVGQNETKKTLPIHSEFPYSGIVLRKIDLPKQEEKIELEELVEVDTIIQKDSTVEEIEYDSNELDLLHEQMEKSQLPATKAAEPPVKTVQNEIKSSTVATNNSDIQSWSIPWASIFGVAASIVAVAAAWFVWNIIQKPLAIDDWADQNVVKTNQAKINVAPTVNSTDRLKEGAFEAPSLDTDMGLVYDLVVEEDIPLHRNINFQELSEQGKVSSVELEKEGLLVLELEDEIFDEVVLAP